MARYDPADAAMIQCLIAQFYGGEEGGANGRLEKIFLGWRLLRTYLALRSINVINDETMGSIKLV
jgi:hypothetical protein